MTGRGGGLPYPCPECGHDGPHPIVEAERPDGQIAVECRACYVEVQVPPA